MKKLRATDPEGFLLRRATEDDTEGHRGKTVRVTEDDTEGHRGKTVRATEDDTEGHRGKTMRATEDDTEGHRGKTVRATEDDTEGHMIGNPLLNQQLARAKEQDIQRSLRAQQQRSEASRPHKK